MRNLYISLLSIVILTACTSSGKTEAVDSSQKEIAPDSIISHLVDPSLCALQLVWKDENNELIGTFSRLIENNSLQDKSVRFAMNGGMFHSGYSPVGLFIDSTEVITPLDTTEGRGNFYLKPNGVFFLTNLGEAAITTTSHFKHSPDISFATQSGPMLLIDGNIHHALTQGSSNKLIRNGVGILPDGKVIFAISTKPINFFDFATFFKNQGCRQALYLDGFVSRMFLPEKGIEQMDGTFGVIIAEISNR